MTLVNLPNLAINPITPPCLHPYHLGASLYMPATRQDIWQVVCRDKLPNINSIIICLEDAIRESEIEVALENLKALLQQWHIFTQNQPLLAIENRPLVFIRSRNPQMLKILAEWETLFLVDGFVLPKVDMLTLPDWRIVCQALSPHHLLMPTLETQSIFNPVHNQELAMALVEAFGQSILALRIGGNDLLACLRLRRPDTTTLYETPIGPLIYQLLGCFVPYGFYLTAPVFEYLDKVDLFTKELAQDVALGLVGKTIIHPSQINAVQQALAVSNATFVQAQAVLVNDAKAVFKHDNAMLEPATHHAWAKEILQRHAVFGIKA